MQKKLESRKHILKKIPSKNIFIVAFSVYKEYNFREYGWTYKQVLKNGLQMYDAI